MLTLQVPSINDSVQGFETLFDIYSRLRAADGPISLTFSNCGSLQHNAVAMIGGMVRTLKSNGRTVTLDWPSMRVPVLRKLALIAGVPDMGPADAVPYREATNLEGTVKYLETQWLGRGWVQLSERLTSEIVGRTYEIFANAIEHSRSEWVCSCGQYSASAHTLKLCVVDFGVGIPEKVRRHFAERGINSPDAIPSDLCIRWAMGRGNSTAAKQTKVSRGIGLDLLREFVTVNQGSLEIFSDSGRVALRAGQLEYSRRPQHSFRGTAVNITFNCDENYYYLADEDVDEPLF